MEQATPRLGFIGLGEAAYRFAKDLSQAGLLGIVAYSPSSAKAAADDPVRRRAAEAGVELLASGLRERFNAREPATIHPVLEAIIEANERGSRRDA